ncbi:glyoxalase [Micromonospora rosaria]|uniref:Glyoxalase n=1 Tax=Micromonospora rosaria TaxID=47874 RepID=A0A136PJ44_9ACTN|nr:VOC family protein [Micromonospora rosaria]KXK58373.1 glyoxalase [Micromonospora rosaria]
MANGGSRPIAPVRKLIAAVLGTVAAFVVLFGLGMTSWAIVALGVALLALAIALGTVHGGGRTWVVGVGHVHSVSEPPTQYAFGRCELQLVIDAPGMPPRTKKIIEPRVPVAKWPSLGQTLPIRVALDDHRHVRVLWDEVPTHTEAAADLPPEFAAAAAAEPVDEVLLQQEAPPWADRVGDDLRDDLRDDFRDPPVLDPLDDDLGARPERREPVVVHQRPGGPVVLEGTLVEQPAGTLPRRATPGPRPPAEEQPDPLVEERVDTPAATRQEAPADPVDVPPAQRGSGYPVDPVDVPAGQGSGYPLDSPAPGQRTGSDLPESDLFDRSPADPVHQPATDPTARSDSDPTARSDSDPTARSESDPTARSESDPTARSESDPIDLPLDDPATARATEPGLADADLDAAIFGYDPDTVDLDAAAPISGVGITVLVTDLTRSLDFYRDVLGFTEVDRGSGNAVLASGTTRLVLREVSEAAPISRRLVHVNLEVNDIQAAYERLRDTGLRFTYAPRVVNRGTKLEVWAAAFRDPDGHGIALTQWRTLTGA